MDKFRETEVQTSRKADVHCSLKCIDVDITYGSS